MNRNFLLNIFFLVILVPCVFSSCRKAKPADETTSATSSTLKKDILVDLSANVIYATYSDLALKANILQTSIVTFSNTPNASNLAASQQAWKNVRSAWEQGEGFLFGPVSIDNIDPRIDTWPIDFARLDSVLSSSAVFTTTYMDNLEESLKGFHPIEYLLFGTNGNKIASSFTTRELDYLAALSTNLNALCNQAKNSWDPSLTGNYTNEFNTAGNGSSIYPTQRAAYEQIIDAMIDICDEVANGKIAEPYINQNPALEESPFASNSIIDFTDNIKSVQNMYLGKYSNDGKGLEDLIKANNLTMDGVIKTRIANSISALGNVTVHFGQAISTQQTQVQNCIQSINDLKDYLETTVKPYIQTLTN
jgi:putative iron-regulated protein